MIQTDTTENPQRKPGAIRGNQYALRHGLFAKQDVIEGEDTNEYLEFIGRVLNEEQVIGAVETQLAARIGGLLWRMGRVSRLEAEVWDRIGKIEERVHQLNLLAHYDARLGRELARTRVELEKTKALRTQRTVETVPVGPLTERDLPYPDNDPRVPVTLIFTHDGGGKSIMCNGNLKEVAPDGTVDYDGPIMDAPTEIRNRGLRGIGKPLSLGTVAAWAVRAFANAPAPDESRAFKVRSTWNADEAVHEVALYSPGQFGKSCFNAARTSLYSASSDQESPGEIEPVTPIPLGTRPEA